MCYKIYKSKSPKYLFKLIPEKPYAYATRNVGNIPCFKIRLNFFKNFVFPSAIIEWNNLDPVKVLAARRKSHLREHKFKHNFQDCLNPICRCGLDIEST